MTQRIVSEFIESNVFVVDCGVMHGTDLGAGGAGCGADCGACGADREENCGAGCGACCGTDGEKNCGVGCVIVDAGARTEDVKKVVGGRRVLGVFLTHGHYDHSVYVTDYAKQFGCKIFASSAVKEYLQNPDYNYSEGKFKVDDFSDFVFLEGNGVVRFVENGNGEAIFFVENVGKTLNANVGLQNFPPKAINEQETVRKQEPIKEQEVVNKQKIKRSFMAENDDQKCDVCVRFLQLGGHSKGDMAYFIGDEIFVGDVLIGRDMGRVDLYGGSRQEMKNSLQKLVEADYRVMHSGHGADNPKAAQDKVAKLWIKFLSR